MIAHPVHAETPRLRRAVHDITARTHAEAVDAPPVLRTRVRHLVGTRPERRPRLRIHRTIEIRVDHRLRMLHTEAHREVLRLHVKTGRVQLLIAVPRRVTDREDDLPVLIPHRVIRKLRVKVNLTAERLNLTADPAHHIDETIRPDMRLRIDEDRRICPVTDKQIQDETAASIRILREGVQLSVREGPGTTLPELRIRVWIQLPRRPETLDILDTLLD